MQLISLIVVTLALIWIWESARWIVWLTLLAVAAAICHTISSTRGAQRQVEAKAKQFQARALERLDHHTDTLLKKAQQSLYRDDYGVLLFSKWQLERDYFIDRVLAIECPGILQALDRGWLQRTIDQRILDLYAQRPVAEGRMFNGAQPIEFEHFCASLLKKAGWEARVTKATGDQGIDILAKFGRLNGVFQCKLYSKPVGNAAVQEAIAGRAFAQANLAAVISNAAFTPSARQLAASANVYLLHFADIEAFTARLTSQGVK